MLQKYQYYSSITPDAPDIALRSKLCRHYSADPTPLIELKVTTG